MENIDVVILCGGLGKRLRPVINDRPKPMAQVNNKPFLDTLIEYVASFGFKRFILCTGYMGEVIRKHYKESSSPLEFVFSQETAPLGTGGAIKNAHSLIQSDSFLVMNGDSFCKFDLKRFYKFHLIKKAMLSIVLSKVRNNQSSGIVILGRDKRIVEFKEKAELTRGAYSSAGIYLMEQEIFQVMKNKRIFSLEYDIFPALTVKDCYGYYCKNYFIDIGTPQNLMKASDFLKHV